MTSADPLSDGVLPVDKPVGPSSHDIVAVARRGLRTRRIGHTGTLDPFASGLLLLCVGSATRVAEYLSGLGKTYTATVRLGETTDTDDHTGSVISRHGADHVGRADVEEVLGELRGSIMQLPPAYSAKKREGKRAYAAAREGAPLALEAVPVVIDELNIVAFEPPDVSLLVRCSTGTYIRAIARDLGSRLGVGGHLTALRRTAVGSIGVDQAIAVSDLGDSQVVQQYAMTTAQALATLGVMPLVDLHAADVAAIRHGRPVPASDAQEGVVALMHGAQLIAIATAGDGMLRPHKVLS